MNATVPLMNEVWVIVRHHEEVELLQRFLSRLTSSYLKGQLRDASWTGGVLAEQCSCQTGHSATAARQASLSGAEASTSQNQTETIARHGARQDCIANGYVQANNVRHVLSLPRIEDRYE